MPAESIRGATAIRRKLDPCGKTLLGQHPLVLLANRGCVRAHSSGLSSRCQASRAQPAVAVGAKIFIGSCLPQHPAQLLQAPLARTAPHRTAPHASPLRACRQHHELLPREPLHAPAPSPEPRARAQDTARSSRPRSPASRRHAALPRNCSPPPPSTSCPGPSNRLRRHVAKGGLGAARGLWGGRGGALPDSSRLPSAPSNFSSSLFVSLRFSSFLTSLKWRCLEKVL